MKALLPTIPNDKKNTYFYDIQMAIPIPVVEEDETNTDQLINLVGTRDDECIQVLMFPYVMSVGFGPMQDTVEISGMDDRLSKFIVESCQLPSSLLGKEECKVAFPSAWFGEDLSFEMGKWLPLLPFESMVKRNSVKVLPVCRAFAVQNAKNNVQHNMLTDESLAGRFARFINERFPEALTDFCDATVPVTPEPPKFGQTESVTTKLDQMEMES